MRNENNDEKKESDLKKYVEDTIIKYTFKAKNFSIEEMNFVDEYCKDRYDNNRKLMILDLIKYKEENSAIILLNEKIEIVYSKLMEELNKRVPLKENTEIKKVQWKGFTTNKSE